MIEPKRSIRREIKTTKHCPESKENARLRVNKSFFLLVSEMERGLFSQIWNLQKKKKKGKNLKQQIRQNDPKDLGGSWTNTKVINETLLIQKSQRGDPSHVTDGAAEGKLFF